MTDPQYKGMSIIIAGYPKDMEMMLAKNVGLKSRFTRFFDFVDWNGDDCADYLCNRLAQQDNYLITAEAEALFPTGFGQLVRYPGEL